MRCSRRAILGVVTGAAGSSFARAAFAQAARKAAEGKKIGPRPSAKERYLFGEPINLGQRAGLLVDDWLVEDHFNVKRRLNLPMKDFKNPLVVKDKPWEKNGMSRATVLYDREAGLFRMWYTIWVRLDFEEAQKKSGLWDPNTQSRVVAYAESEDGLVWKKPLVGQPYGGQARTNVVLKGEHRNATSGHPIFNHPSSGQPGKFLMSYADFHPKFGRSLHLAYSDDGITWRRDPANPVLYPVLDTCHTLCYDEENQRWLLYTRPVERAGTRDHSKFTGVFDDRNFQRRTALSIGATPQTLGPQRMLRFPEEDEPPDYDVFSVQRVGSHYIAMIDGMYNPVEYNSQVYLATSGDGIHWNRMPGSPPFIPLGRAGDFDAGQAHSVLSIVDVGDEYFLYYDGTPKPQKVPDNPSNIGLARLPRDRFIAQMADSEGGYLLTREVIVSGKHLIVNMAVPVTVGKGQQQVRFAAELVRPRNAANPGIIKEYSFETCRTEALDGLDVMLEWEKGSDLSALKGQPVMIRFFMRDVGLYSFRFAS